MTQIAPLRGKLGQYSGQVRAALKIQVENVCVSVFFPPGFGTRFWPPLRQTQSLQQVGGEEILSTNKKPFGR